MCQYIDMSTGTVAFLHATSHFDNVTKNVYPKRPSGTFRNEYLFNWSDYNIGRYLFPPK